MSDAPKWEDVSDWSGLPEVYLTKVQRQQGMFWRVEACSVPMAIGPEVPLVVRHPAVLAELPEVKALIAAAVEETAQHIVSEAEKLAEGEPSAAPALAFLTELADEVRALIPADHKAALDAYVAGKLREKQEKLGELLWTMDWNGNDSSFQRKAEAIINALIEEPKP